MGGRGKEADPAGHLMNMAGESESESDEGALGSGGWGKSGVSSSRGRGRRERAAAGCTAQPRSSVCHCEGGHTDR